MIYFKSEKERDGRTVHRPHRKDSRPEKSNSEKKAVTQHKRRCAAADKKEVTH